MLRFKRCTKELTDLLHGPSAPDQIDHILECIDMIHQFLSEDSKLVGVFLEMDIPTWAVRNARILNVLIALYMELINVYHVDPSLLDVSPFLSTTLADYQAQVAHVSFLESLSHSYVHDKRLMYALINYIYHPGIVGDLAWQGVLNLCTENWVKTIDLGQYLASGLGAFIIQHRDSKRLVRKGSIKVHKRTSSKAFTKEWKESKGSSSETGSLPSGQSVDPTSSKEEPHGNSLEKHLIYWNKLVALNPVFIKDFDIVLVEPILFARDSDDENDNDNEIEYGDDDNDRGPQQRGAYDYDAIAKVLRVLEPALAGVVIKHLNTKMLTPRRPVAKVCGALSVIHAAIQANFELTKKSLFDTLDLASPDYQSSLRLFKMQQPASISEDLKSSYYKELYNTHVAAPTTEIVAQDHLMLYLYSILENRLQYSPDALCWLTTIFKELIVQGCTSSGAFLPVIQLLKDSADRSQIIRHHLCEIEALVLNSLSQ